MAMSHKAYAFDYAAFERELAPLLLDALASGNAAALGAFIDTERARLRSPDNGAPLSPEWRSTLTSGDVHELGDIALTKYYDTDSDRGLGEKWAEIDDELPETARAYLLGEAFGPEGNPFDPGRMGSYFQSPEGALQSLTVLARCRHPELARFMHLLSIVTGSGQGLYVTF